MSEITLGSKKNPNLSLHFFPDGSFTHRRMDTEGKFLVQKTSDKIAKAWALLYNLRFRFDGVKKITAGMYTITHEHDMVYDPFNQVGNSFNQNGKAILKKGGGPVQAFITKTKEDTCLKHAKSKKQNPHYDKAFWLIGSVIIILGFAIFIAAVT
ncbi:MAG: hypothetical protein WC312_07290 [Candidatus Omnitrophota bacterium]|jgi:hypothetical protein